MLVHNFPITRVNFLFFGKLICHKMSTTTNNQGFFFLGDDDSFSVSYL